MVTNVNEQGRDFPYPAPKKHKQRILEEAVQLTRDDRNRTYGEPQAQFACAADLTTAYLARVLAKNGGKITPHDIAMMEVLKKVSRIACGSYKDDNYVDLVGYGAIAGELKGEEYARETEQNKAIRASQQAESASA